MLEVERLAGPGAKVRIDQGACGYVASVFRDAEDHRQVLYHSRDGDSRREAIVRLVEAL